MRSMAHRRMEAGSLAALMALVPQLFDATGAGVLLDCAVEAGAWRQHAWASAGFSRMPARSPFACPALPLPSLAADVGSSSLPAAAAAMLRHFGWPAGWLPLLQLWVESEACLLTRQDERWPPRDLAPSAMTLGGSLTLLEAALVEGALCVAAGRLGPPSNPCTCLAGHLC